MKYSDLYSKSSSYKKRKMIINLWTLFILFGILGSGCKKDHTITTTEIEITKINNDGGRVAWYSSNFSNHELIAFDAIVNDITKRTEIFTMQPDGSEIYNLSGNNDDVPPGFIGQPAWHPDGEHILFQVENENSQGLRYNHMAWGINQDLWIIKRDGTGAEKVWETPLNHAALHAHFNADGTKLIFAERIATGEAVLSPLLTPGGENPWAGWQIHIADFDINKIGVEKLSNHQILFGEGEAKDRGFFETHGFRDDHTIVYSHTEGGAAYCDDIFTAGADGSNVFNLIQSPTSWEEHGMFSPSGNSMLFISSRIDPDWTYPENNVLSLRTELYLNTGNDIKRLTEFNKNGDADKRYLTSGSKWDRTGKRIVIQVAPVDAVTGDAYTPEIWMITFSDVQ